MAEFDDYDKKILCALQTNAELSMVELGDIVGLSHTPCWRRTKRLEEEGYIKQRVTLLDAKRLNLGVSVHAYITIKKQTILTRLDHYWTSNGRGSKTEWEIDIETDCT